jgi:hypothetical protein
MQPPFHEKTPVSGRKQGSANQENMKRNRGAAAVAAISPILIEPILFREGCFFGSATEAGFLASWCCDFLPFPFLAEQWDT